MSLTQDVVRSISNNVAFKSSGFPTSISEWWDETSWFFNCIYCIYFIFTGMYKLFFLKEVDILFIPIGCFYLNIEHFGENVYQVLFVHNSYLYIYKCHVLAIKTLFNLAGRYVST